MLLITMNEDIGDAPAAASLQVLFSEEFTPAASTTMNENIYPQITQIAQIILSFSLRPPRSLRFIYEGDSMRLWRTSK